MIGQTMPNPARLLVVALLVWLAGSARLASAQSELVIKGSDTIGEHLGQALAQLYMERRPDTSVRWESIGSSSAFVGILDGSAALGASSRAIRAQEVARAEELGLRLREYVIGYDGIAVIVHPSNPVDELSIGQLAELFVGAAPSWSRYGGGPGPVRRVSRPSYSGTHAFFKDTVLGPDREFSDATDFIEETDEITRSVAADPSALSYVGLGFVEQDDVKVLRVRKDASSPGVLPTERSIRDGSYPIFRPLFLYAREGAPEAASQMIALALSDAGRALVEQNDFIAPDRTSAAIDAALLPAVAAASPSVRQERARQERILFEFGSTGLTPEATQALTRLVSPLLTGRYRATLVGHCDSTGPAWANRIVARERVARVAAFLRSSGVPEERIDRSARSSDEPVATNRTAEGRSLNRRVDVILIPIGATRPAERPSG